MLIAIVWLAFAAVFLELAQRAPVMDFDGDEAGAGLSCDARGDVRGDEDVLPLMS